MTQQEYEIKKTQMLKLAGLPQKTPLEKERMRGLAAEISLYETENGLVNENEFYSED